MKKIKFLILLSFFFVLPVFAQTYTMNEIKNHNTKKDCWMLISGKIYNVTSFLGYHPGGDATMLPFCGKDATKAFATKGSETGDHHPTSYALLKKYYIGDLQDEIVTGEAEKSIVNKINEDSGVEENQLNETKNVDFQNGDKEKERDNNIKYLGGFVAFLIALLFYIILGIFYYLSKNKRLFKLKIKKLTIIILLVTFVFSGLLGLYLTFFNNFYFGQAINLKSIHITFSAIFVISVFVHMIFHFKKILNYLAISKQKDNNI